MLFMKKEFVIFGVVIVLLISAGFYFFNKINDNSPAFLYGNETLKIKVVDAGNNYVENIEVDLWSAENANGPPTAGISATNNGGIAEFKIPEGNYLIGFNSNNFPGNFVYPEKTGVNVIKGSNEKTILLKSLQD